MSRLRVVSSKEEDLSPIIVAIDDMQRRLLELRSELNSHDIKRIQLRLQGSVSVQVKLIFFAFQVILCHYEIYIWEFSIVQVNQGPLTYARAFFEKESEYPAQEMNTLKAIFRYANDGFVYASNFLYCVGTWDFMYLFVVYSQGFCGMLWRTIDQEWNAHTA